jgi:monomeric sarcosine oxidase
LAVLVCIVYGEGKMTYQPQIVVIGAGIVGLATAYALLEQGMSKVLVLEQAVVDHTQAASSSVSRLLRFEYTDPLYAYMVKLSLGLWKELEKRTRKRLYTPTGILSLGKEGDGTREAYEVTHELGLPGEILSAGSCRQRFPEFDLAGYDVLAFNWEGGILRASNCLHTLKKAVLSVGGEIVETSRVTQIEHEDQKRPIRLKLSSGEEVAAERVVVAIGPWVHRLLNQQHIPVKLTRQYLLYFAGLAPAKFGTGVFPAFIGDNVYGFPIHRGSKSWLKAASHVFGSPVDPDAAVSLEDPVIAQNVHELENLLPALRSARLAHVEPCIYDLSPDEDFILDYVPGDSRIIFATGLSGHGFKFGLLLGQLLCSLICEVPPGKPPGQFRGNEIREALLELPLERFRLSRFQCQQVYAASIV